MYNKLILTNIHTINNPHIDIHYYTQIWAYITTHTYIHTIEGVQEKGTNRCLH